MGSRQGDASSVAAASSSVLASSASSSSSSSSSSTSALSDSSSRSRSSGSGSHSGSSSSGSSSSGSGSSSYVSVSGAGTGARVVKVRKKPRSKMRSRRAARHRVERSSDVDEGSASAVEGRYLVDGSTIVDVEASDEDEIDSDDPDAAAKLKDAGPTPAEYLHNPLWTNRPREPVSIFWHKRGSNDDPNSLKPRTLIEVIRQTQASMVLYPAMRIKRSAFEWETVTWKAYYKQAKRVARSLMKMGIKRGMRVGIFAPNSPQWCIAFMGAILVGGIPVGINDQLDEGTVSHILVHASISVLFLGGESEAELMSPILRHTHYEKLFAIVSFGQLKDETTRFFRNVSVYPFVLDEFLLLSGTDESMLQRLVRRRQKSIHPGMCATIVYTAGTTAAPKACMLSHDNLVWTGSIMSGMLGAQTSDRAVSFMSMSSVFGLLVDLVVPLITGHLVSFTAKSALQGSLGDIIREVKPTFFVGMPFVFDAIRLRYQEFEYSHKGSYVRNTLLSWAQAKGLAGTYALQRGESLPWGWRLAKFSAFLPFRSRLGFQNTRIVVVLGAHLSVDTHEFFQSMGLQIYESYGSTESTGIATLSLPKACVTGTAGRRLFGTGVSTQDDRDALMDPSGTPLEQESGEGVIRVYGRNRFMGYFRARKTDQADLFDDHGWFNTGDYGRFDDGFLTVEGKANDMITLADGTTVSPTMVQSKLVPAIPGISHAIVHGTSSSSSLIALFTVRALLNRHTGAATTRIAHGIIRTIYEKAIRATAAGQDDEEMANMLNVRFDDVDTSLKITVAEAVAHPAVRAYIQTNLDAYNDTAPEPTRIGAWELLDHPLTVYSGELDTCHKIRRDVIITTHAEIITDLLSRV